MKPGKNRIFCPACGRSKIVFSTKEEADRFISFNRVEILREHHKAPVRSYYCPMCCAFHVTSNPSLEAGEEMDEKVAERLEQIIKLSSKAHSREAKNKSDDEIRKEANKISQRLYDAINKRVLLNLLALNVEEALNSLEALMRESEEEAESNAVWASRLPTFKDRIRQYHLIINSFTEYRLNREKVNNRFSEQLPKSILRCYEYMIANENLLVEYNSILKQLEAGVGIIDKEAALNLFNSARERVDGLKGDVTKSVKKKLYKRIKDLLPEYAIGLSECGFKEATPPSESTEEKRKQKIREQIKRVISILELANTTDNAIIRKNCITSALEMLKKVPNCDEKIIILNALGIIPDHYHDFGVEEQES